MRMQSTSVTSAQLRTQQPETMIVQGITTTWSPRMWNRESSSMLHTVDCSHPIVQHSCLSNQTARRPYSSVAIPSNMLSSSRVSTSKNCSEIMPAMQSKEIDNPTVRAELLKALAVMQNDKAMLGLEAQMRQVEAKNSQMRKEVEASVSWRDCSALK